MHHQFCGKVVEHDASGFLRDETGVDQQIYDGVEGFFGDQHPRAGELGAGYVVGGQMFRS
jgi:hypothetical protein